MLVSFLMYSICYLTPSDVHVQQTSTRFSRRCFPLINETCDTLPRIACRISSAFNENTTQSDERVVNKSNNDVHCVCMCVCVWGGGVLLSSSFPFSLSLFFLFLFLSLLLLVILVRGNRNGIVQSHRREEGMTEEGAKMRMVAGEIRRCWCLVRARSYSSVMIPLLCLMKALISRLVPSIWQGKYR